MTDGGGQHRPLSLPPGAVAAHHQRELRAVAEARPTRIEVMGISDGAVAYNI
jgi:hypothetical protein